MSTTVIRWGLKTDVGMVRRVNQDSVMANGSLFVVADGMGGHRGGEVASGITVGHFTDVGRVTSIDELRDGVVNANTMIRERAASDPDLGGMGTTVVAIAVLPRSIPGEPVHLGVANVGDSRVYVYENDELVQLSTDHSLVDELVRAGQLTEAEAVNHPQRNVVTRALGADHSVDVDTWVIPTQPGQRYLLCSDGLVNEVANDDVGAVLAETGDPEAAAIKLVEMANTSGGRDNISVLIVDIEAGP